MFSIALIYYENALLAKLFPQTLCFEFFITFTFHILLFLIFLSLLLFRWNEGGVQCS